MDQNKENGKNINKMNTMNILNVYIKKALKYIYIKACKI